VTQQRYEDADGKGVKGRAEERKENDKNGNIFVRIDDSEEEFRFGYGVLCHAS